MSVDGQAVHGVHAIIAVLDEAGNKPANLVIQRDGKQFNVTIQPIWADNGTGEPGLPPRFRSRAAAIPR